MTDLCDTEQVPLLEQGGVEAFLRREVLLHAPDAWFDESSVKIILASIEQLAVFPVQPGFGVVPWFSRAAGVRPLCPMA